MTDGFETGVAALFVYGTLRHDEQHEMFHVLARYGHFIGEGTLTARLYDIGEYPGAVRSTVPSDTVRGEVYELSQPKLVLAELDRYEGCGPDDAQPTEFIREIVNVKLTDRRSMRAWAYLYNRPTEGLKRIEAGDYLAFKRSTNGET